MTSTEIMEAMLEYGRLCARASDHEDTSALMRRITLMHKIAVAVRGMERRLAASAAHTGGAR